MKFYTGVGSRETPDHILAEMTALARRLQVAGFTLRSGGAPGADTAFEDGAEFEPHIYLPWPGFNGHTLARQWRPSVSAYKMAATVHPAWNALSGGARALHARNCHQVLGDDLAKPSLFLVCWTKDGCESEATRTRETGGTGTAIALASRHGVPVFNLNRPGARDALEQFLRGTV